MRKLLAFFIEKRHWLLFILLELISFVIIYRNNAYQHEMIMSSANVFVDKVMSVPNVVNSYFNLRNLNQDLLLRNNSLEKEVIYLRAQIDKLSLDKTDFSRAFRIETDTIVSDSSLHRADYVYDYILVNAINNSTMHSNNYITINKGSKDGIHPDMAVVSPYGVVGIVMTVKDHYSIVISLLNSKFRLSSKVKNSNYFGTLLWKGDDARYAYLEELPTHATFQVGDTIITSGNSTVFPPGIVVGVVDSYNKQHDDNFFSLKVKLATNFQNLNALSVIENKLQKEQEEAEEGISND